MFKFDQHRMIFMTLFQFPREKDPLVFYILIYGIFNKYIPALFVVVFGVFFICFVFFFSFFLQPQFITKRHFLFADWKSLKQQQNRGKNEWFGTIYFSILFADTSQNYIISNIWHLKIYIYTFCCFYIYIIQKKLI